MILEVDEQGEVTLPSELIQAAPHTRLEAERQGETVVLKAAVPVRRRFNIADFPVLPGDPTGGNPKMTFRREDMYDDDGR